MARIGESELERLKTEVSVARLAEASGIKLEARGKDLVGACPFHEDATPSLSVTPEKNLFHCFGCGAAGGPIDWVMKKNGVSFRHAVELLREGLSTITDGPVKRTRMRALPAPVALDADDQALLDSVLGYYHETLKNSPEALDYLAKRGIGKSEAVVRGRRIAIRRFIAWCDDRGLSDPKEITKPILERYQRHLFYYRKTDGAPLSLGSQHACLTPLKTFFKWLAKANHILSNPASELELPKQPKHLPRALLSVEDIEAILRAAEPATASGLRDRAMLEMLYSTGLRRTELANLRRYDVDLSRLIVFVREGKGRQDRVVPLGERAALWLDKYMIESRPQLAGNDTEALFVSDYGEPIRPDFLASRVRRAMEEAGIDKPGSCHLFRHACATHMLDNGADIRFIQAMLGHAALSSTERYTHVAIGKLQQIHAATHPAKLTRGSSAEAARAEQKHEREAMLEALLDEVDDEESGADSHA